MSLKVLLVDDHTLFRMGLAELLEHTGLDVIASTGNGQDAVKYAQEKTPDVILLDLRMPEISGLDILERLRNEGIEIPVAMLTTSTDDEDVNQAFKRGAQGYLLKDMEPDELVSALKRIVNGEMVVAPELTATLARIIQGVKKEEPVVTNFSSLTPRELEILCHIAEGQSNKMIARSLGISDGTVKLHVKAILRKLDVHSRVEAAVMAVEQSICEK